jgi:hypothetical protein
LVRVDLKSAYWHLSVHPDSRHLLQFELEGQTWQFASMPFGLAIAPRVFTKVMRPVVSVLRTRGIRCVVYLDDLLLLSSSKQDSERAAIMAVGLLQSLGFLINKEKSDLVPQQQQRFLGVVVDSTKLRWGPTEERVRRVRREAVKWRNRAKRLLWPTIPQLRRVIGLLVYMQHGVPETAVRKCHLQTCLRLAMQRVGFRNYAEQRRAPCRLSLQAIEELDWWARLPIGVACLVSWPTPTATATSDASDDAIGWLSEVDGTRTTGRGALPGALLGKSSAVRELFGIRAAVLATLQRMGPQREWTSLRVRSDNQAALHCLRRGYSTRPAMMAMARETVLAALSRNIWLVQEYLPGEKNVMADALSRYESPLNEATVGPWVLSWVQRQLRGPTPSMDVFARAANTQLQRFLTWRQDPRATGMDALSTRWDAVSWAFPPPPLLLATLQRFEEQEQCQAMYLVGPQWASQPFQASLLDNDEWAVHRVDLPSGAVWLSAALRRQRNAIAWRCWLVSKRSVAGSGRRSARSTLST